MTRKATFGAIDAGVVLAGLSLLSQVMKRGREGYHTLEKQGMAPPTWTLPLVGIGAAAATIAAINPDRIVTRAIKWLKQTFSLSSPATRRRKVAAKRSRSPMKRVRAKSASARAKMNHVAGKRPRMPQSEARH